MRPVRIFVCLFFTVALVSANPLHSQNLQVAQQSAPLTKDRLSDDEMRQMVKRPLHEMLNGAFSKGQADFERLLAARGSRAGFRSLAYADMVSAMGFALYVDSPDSAKELKARAIEYLKRAIIATRAAVGPTDPQLALALNDYTTAQLNETPLDPPADVDADLEEAYQIRLASLGPSNSETGDALADLAKVKGLASRTGVDPQKVAASGKLFEQSILIAQANAEAEPQVTALAYLEAAEFWARNNDISKAQSYFLKAEQQYDAGQTDDLNTADAKAFAAFRFAADLQSSAHDLEAEAVRKEYATQIAEMLVRAEKAGSVTITTDTPK